MTTNIPGIPVSVLLSAFPDNVRFRAAHALESVTSSDLPGSQWNFDALIHELRAEEE